MKILYLNASITGKTDYMAKQYIKRVLKSSSFTEVDLNKELGNEKILTNQNMQQFYDPASVDKYIKMLTDYDVVVVSSPLVNFKVAPALSLFLDKVTVTNKTFRYSQEKGLPEGMLKSDTKFVLIASSGSNQKMLGNNVKPFQAVIDSMKFIGLKDVELRYADGTNTPENNGKSSEEVFEYFESSIIR